VTNDMIVFDFATPMVWKKMAGTGFVTLLFLIQIRQPIVNNSSSALTAFSVSKPFLLQTPWHHPPYQLSWPWLRTERVRVQRRRAVRDGAAVEGMRNLFQ